MVSRVATHEHGEIVRRLEWRSRRGGGGSIRIPSSLCGLYGLKPTYGRVPYDVDPVYGPGLGFICHGPITRTVRDSAFLLSVMSGHDREDYRSIKSPAPDYVKELESPLGPLRVAWSSDLGYAEVEPEVDGHLFTVT